MKKIAIIGAGVSSLCAASRLKDLGHHVTIFEKSRGRGGRLATKRLDIGHYDIGAQYFTARSEGFRKTVGQWMEAQTAARWDFTPHKVSNGILEPSPDTRERFVGIPDMSSIAHTLAKDCDIHFQTRVQRCWRDGKWNLESETGQHYSGFDHLVFSLPAEQTRHLLTSTSGTDILIPNNVHTPCWALGIATRGKVDPAIQGIFGDETISWVSRLNAKPQRSAAPGSDDAWMLHFSPQWTQKNDKESNPALEQVALSWLSKHVHAGLEISHSYRHFWRYANINTDNPELENSPAFYFDAKQNLAVIGAWCCGGKIEGAYLSATAFTDEVFN